MTCNTCIEKLKILLETTIPADQSDAIQKFAVACSLVTWAARNDATIREPLAVFLSYFEIFALNLDGHEEITRRACENQLADLTIRFPRDS